MASSYVKKYYEEAVKSGKIKPNITETSRSIARQGAGSSDSGFGFYDTFASLDDEKLRRGISSLYAKRGAGIETGLSRGMSYEDISAQTGATVEDVKKRAEQSRPGYGVQSPKGLGEKAGSFFELFTKAPKTVAAGTARSFAGGDITKGEKAANVNLEAARENIIRTLRDPNVPQERKDKLLSLLNEETRTTVKQQAAQTKQLESETDKGKFLGATAEMASYLFGGTGLKAAYKAGGMARAARAIGATTASGAVGGAGSAMQQEGDVGVTDVLKGAAVGGALGAGLSAGGAVLGTGAKYGAKKGQSFIAAIPETKGWQKVASTPLGQKVGSFKSAAGAYLGSSTNYIEKAMGNAIEEAEGIYKGWRQKDVVQHLATNVRTSDALADAGRQANEGWQATKAIYSNKTEQEAAELGAFISKKQDAINFNRDLETGVRVGKKPKKVPVGTDEQEAAYAALNQATKPKIQEAYDAGLITKQQYDTWMADTDYTRVQRQLEETVVQSSGGGLQPKEKGPLSQRRKGSSKEAVDPTAAFIDWDNRITKEIEKNKLAGYVRDKLVEKGVTKPLRVAGRVIERNELYGEAAQSRYLRNQLARKVKSQSKYVRRIEAELNKLNKEGLDESLKKTADVDTLTGKIVPEAKMAPRETKKIIQELIDTDPAKLQAIRDRIAKKEPKLAEAIDEITALQGEYNAARQEVNDMVQRARSLADVDPMGENTMRVFENGIRELYTVSPQIARQLRGVSDIQLKQFTNAAMFSSKVLRGGATALNAAFAIPNFVMDQITSFGMSKNKFATHNPLVFLASLKETALKPLGQSTLGKIGFADANFLQHSEAYLAWAARNKGMTRNDLVKGIKKSTQAAYDELGVKPGFVRGAKSLGRGVSDLISVPENTTRFQNYLGTLKKEIKNIDPKLPPEEYRARAMALADEAARNNSINFLNSGELSTFMKIFNPYMNAGIQGSATLGRALRDRPISTSLAISATTLTPVALSTYWNFSDPRRAQRYMDGTTEYERKSNVIMVMNDGSIVKIPIPPPYRAFAQPLRNMIESEYVGDRQGFVETAKNILIDPFSPIGTTKNEILASVVPQPVKPLVEIGLNRDLYFGKDIVPEYMKGLPAGEQAYENTPEIYKTLGQKFGVSPLQIRKLVTGYTAGGGEGALTSAGQAFGQETGGRSTVEQVQKRFVKGPTEGSGQVKSKFYETYSPLKQRKEAYSKKVTDAVKRGDIEEANKIALMINDEVEQEKKKLRETYGRYEADLSALYEQFDYLKFPVSGNRLSQGSINARTKNK